MLPGCINRIAWGTKLLLTAVWASFANGIFLCHLLKAQHCSLSPNECFNPPLAPPAPTCPQTQCVILQKLKKLSQKPAAFK